MPPVGLRLLSVVQHTDVVRYPGQPDLFVGSGVYVAPTGGPFEVHATAGQRGVLSLWQVRRDSQGVHQVRQIKPPTPASFTDGFPGFFQAVVRDSAGKTVTQALAPFCPSGGYGQSRVDGSGPDQPTFPYFCGGSLTQEMVWGIDQGWASAVFLDLPAPANMPDGTYTLSLRVADTYLRQLGIPSDAAGATIALNVSTYKDPCPPLCGPAPATAAPAPGGQPPGSGGEGAPPATTSSRAASGSAAAAKGSGNDGVHTGTGGEPDLTALPAHDVTIEHNTDDSHDYLDFGATIWNAGTGPLVLEGFRQGSAPTMTATQFIYQNGQPVRSAVTGQFEFDTRPGHDHWHMADVAQYDLLSADGSRLVLSDKQSFCLAPTDPIDLTAPGANWQPDRTGLWSACAGRDSIWLREVLPAGWGDTYYQNVAGQSFDITTIPNGHYLLRITTDPFHRLIETTYTNNSSQLPVTLAGSPGNRTVTTG